ncbi:glycosyltransferase domain-containing protein [Wenyingzhuangia marina]|uniref:TOD1/MUCI70 glycosyltransferase-like domain-containing protein n=1 Tax=Wenyingzhuangia marina TaxID=1195760 RepID=A0A1M5WU07_9FLAO|nr:glycosyltransferase domain-containing protein [Wenyingzhuangia marina]GGF80469.1 hypothetical protein GCM10011397_24300 [Wenyingzhuangia marina]SHH90473.1 Protein of unknown function [Wenyingzhuangia marina]
MSLKKIVVYTALFGEYCGIIEQPKIKGVDYICYTDQDVSSNSWKVIKITPPIHEDNTRSNRYYKILPHKHLKEYDISIYIDANYLIIGDIISLIKNVFKNNLFTCFNHNLITGDARNCIYKELEHILSLHKQKGVFKDHTEVMKKQLEKYRNEGYPKNNGLIRGSVLIRQHNHKDVIAFMEKWWEELNTGSRRDQLSCNYAAWKTNFTINYLPGNGVRGNKWFLKLGSSRKSFTKKLIEYKLKRLFGIYKFS